MVERESNSKKPLSARPTEGELFASEAFVRALVDGAGDGIFVVDLEGRFSFVNDFIAKSSGFPKEAFLGRHFLELIREEDHEMTRRNFDRVLAGEDVPAYELAYRAASEEEMWVEITTARIVMDDEVRGVLAISRNLQKRKRMERQLRDSEEKFRSLVAALPHMVTIVQDSRVVFANEAWRAHFGDPNAIERDLAKLVVPGLQSRARAFLQKRLRGDGVPNTYETVLVNAAGREIPVEVHARAMEYGGRPAVQYVVMDLSERRALEAQLQHAHRLEAVGVLAGGVAHDFNNMLTAILATADMMRHRHPADSPDGHAANLIYRAARQSAGLTQQLLSFARKSKPERKRLDIRHLINDVCELLASTLGDDVDVVEEVALDATWVQGDPGQLQQVLMNLIVNARAAMPDGGRLSLRTTREVLEDGPLLEAFALDAGAYVRIVVEDTGVGMSAAIRDRVFEPFFTAKPDGTGSGMGLSVVYGIVRAHHGAIAIESEEQVGTSVSVFLRPAEEDVSGERLRSTPASGRGVVLLVEDESLVRESAERLVESLGYEVISCVDGNEAVRRYREEGRRVAVALIDVRMPKMNGWACLEELRRIDPELPAIMTSGQGHSSAEPPKTGPHEFLAKPYDIDSLGEALVRQISARRR